MSRGQGGDVRRCPCRYLFYDYLLVCQTITVMKSNKLYLGVIVLVILLLLSLPYAWKLVQILFFPKNVSVLKQLSLYQWTTIGFIGYAIIRRFFVKNNLWFESFTHELTHIVVALFIFRKVHSFHAEEGSGGVYTSGLSNSTVIPMALAPYCLPIFTYLLLVFRSLMDFNGMWIYDTLIGISMSFHVYCFIHQTGSYQTDINQYPLFFSYLYIFTAHLINVCIIIVALFPSYNVFTSIWRYLVQVYENAVWVLSLVF